MGENIVKFLWKEWSKFSYSIDKETAHKGQQVDLNNDVYKYCTHAYIKSCRGKTSVWMPSCLCFCLPLSVCVTPGDYIGFDGTVFSYILKLWDWAALVENMRSRGTDVTMRSYLEQCDRPRGCLAATPPPSNPRYQPQEVPHSHFLLSAQTMAIVAGWYGVTSAPSAMPC